MKKIFLGLVLLAITSCEDSTAHGFWGPSAPTGVWDQEKTPVCENYNSCHESCELYGNCE
jgi:hypothetical protein